MFEKEAEEIANKRCHEIMCYGHCSFNSPKHHRCGEWHREYNCALAGLHEGQPKWHDLKKNPSDVPQGDIHRQILLQDRYGYIYTGNYYPKDDCHSEDCFAVKWLDKGFQGCNFVAFEQIAKWKEFKE